MSKSDIAFIGFIITLFCVIAVHRLTTYRSKQDAIATRRKKFLSLIAEIKAKATTTQPDIWVNFYTNSVPDIRLFFEQTAADLSKSRRDSLGVLVDHLLTFSTLLSGDKYNNQDKIIDALVKIEEFYAV